MDHQAIAAAKAVYEKTEAIYRATVDELGDQALGYKILYGPPSVSPPVLFVGFQPGGGKKDAQEGLAAGERSGWPDTIEYITENYRLAKQIREIWPREFLRSCVALNAVFFRAKDQESWKTLAPKLRKKLEVFSIEQSKFLIRNFSPKIILAWGISTFYHLSDKEPTILERGEKGNRIIVKGQICGIDAYGVIHLSGARLSRLDRSKINERLRNITETFNDNEAACMETWLCDARITLNRLASSKEEDIAVWRGGNSSTGVGQLPYCEYGIVINLYWAVLHAAGLACALPHPNSSISRRNYSIRDPRFYEGATMTDLLVAADKLQGSERFCDGAWLDAFKSGVLFALLSRLVELRRTPHS